MSSVLSMSVCRLASERRRASSRGSQFSDILDAGNRTGEVAVFVKQRAGLDRRIDTRSIFAQELEIMTFGHALFARLEIAGSQFDAAGVHEVEQGPADHLFGAVPEHGSHGRVDKGGARFVVDVPDALRQVVDQQPVFVFAGTQGGLGSLAPVEFFLQFPRPLADDSAQGDQPADKDS